MVFALIQVKPTKSGRENSRVVKGGLFLIPVLLVLLIVWVRVSTRRERRRRFEAAVEDRRRRGRRPSLSELLGHKETGE